MQATLERIGAVFRSAAHDLSALVPRRAREALKDKRTDIVVDMSEAAVSIARRSRAGAEHAIAHFTREEIASGHASEVVAPLFNERDDKEHVIVRLSETELLRKMVVLPLAAARNLNEIVRFEIDRQSPIDPERIHFDSRVLRLDAAANKVDVEVRIFKKDAIQSAVDNCSALGLRVAGVEFVGGAPEEKAFPLDAKAARHLYWQRASTPALSLLACGLALAVLAGCEIREEVASSDLHDRVASARTRAHASGEILTRMADARDRVTLLVAEKRRPSLAQIVSDVTRLLPDGSWITQLDKNDAEIHIRGFSPNASQLVEIFERSPQFAKAHFKAPLVKSANGNLDQFDLSFTLQAPKR